MTGSPSPAAMEAGATPTELMRPVLDESTRAFVRNALAGGLVEIDDIKKVVMSLMAENENVLFTPKRLATGLKGAGLLTSWQASKLLAGKSRGFHLGSYRLLKPIGKGGMGMVYLGEHHVMKRLMALKILPPEATNNPQRLERFKSEARACAQLDHPNIVRAYDFAETNGRHYIVMEYVDGIDLHHLVVRDGLMSTAEVIDAMTQACSGLSHAHERGIVHRDIKPANLLMRTDGVLKVSDLGLARIGMSEYSDMESRRLLGTADFVAPEQAINSQTIDARADIYSLGCTLFFLLTGRPPFEGDSIRQRLAKHQTAEIPDVRTFRPDCPASIAELTKRMMAKRPAERPKSATELLSQLNRIRGASNDRPSSANRFIKPADTSIDDQVYLATVDDTSLSPSSSVDMEVVDVAEVDLGQTLDHFDLGTLPTAPAVSVAASSFPVDRHGGSNDHLKKSSPRQSFLLSWLKSESSQVMILGMGLTIAVLALLTVLFVAYFTLTKPNAPAPRIKALEDGKGGNIVIVNPSISTGNTTIRFTFPMLR